MAEDKQDKIIELLARINLQHKTIIHNQNVLINNQGVLSNNIKVAQKGIVNTLNNIKSTNDNQLQQLKNNDQDINNQIVNGKNNIISQLKINNTHGYDNFEELNVLTRIMVDMMALGSDIYAATNSVARKQGAIFYTNYNTPGGYRSAAKNYLSTLNAHEYYTGDQDDDN